MADETIIWRGRSSQLRNFHIYLVCLVVVAACVALAVVLGRQVPSPTRQTIVATFLGLAVIPVLYAVWKSIQLRSVEYEITTERLRVRTGIFSKRTDELELYRVKDYTVVEPFWQRVFGIGSIAVSTHDATTPSLLIAAVSNAAGLREEIRKNVEICRDRKKVRMMELE